MKYVIICTNAEYPEFLTSWNILTEERYSTLSLYRLLNKIPFFDTVICICDTMEEAFERRNKIVAMFSDRYLERPLTPCL